VQRDILPIDAVGSLAEKTSRPSDLTARGTCRGLGVRETVLIRHIVFFSVKRKDEVEAVRSGLMALGEIPHSRLFEVSLNTKVDPFCDEIDVVVYAEFEDQAALAAYKAHPLYAETTAKVRPKRELRFSADVASNA
jgi:hypothetical protein